jgi:hypothetical protein
MPRLLSVHALRQAAAHLLSSRAKWYLLGEATGRGSLFVLLILVSTVVCNEDYGYKKH